MSQLYFELASISENRSFTIQSPHRKLGHTVQTCMIIGLYYCSEKQVNNGVYYTAVNDLYLYKLQITWISIYFLFTTILMYI